ncbi:MAG: Flp pilus assembly protein CpaB [Hyphomicrobium sp.]
MARRQFVQRRRTGMRREVILALGLAALSGIVAAVGINGWMSSEFLRIMHSQPAPAPAIEMTTVVVAKELLGFGAAVTQEKLVEAEWPVKNVPQGSFKTIAEFLGQQETRVVLEPVQASEPILAGKVTGPGQRSGLATMLQPGKKAVTIRINDVIGVGGFVLPGDRVDIFATTDGKNVKTKDGSEGQSYTDLLLQNVRVLAVDQTFDPKHTAPILGRTVTVETDMLDAQKITLASTVGSLSLVLRENGTTASVEDMKRLTVADLPGNSGDNSSVAAFEPTIAVALEGKTVAPVKPAERGDMAKVSVVRATAQTDYDVLRQDNGQDQGK